MKHSLDDLPVRTMLTLGKRGIGGGGDQIEKDKTSLPKEICIPTRHDFIKVKIKMQ